MDNKVDVIRKKYSEAYGETDCSAFAKILVDAGLTGVQRKLREEQDIRYNLKAFLNLTTSEQIKALTTLHYIVRPGTQTPHYFDLLKEIYDNCLEPTKLDQITMEVLFETILDTLKPTLLPF
jgi:hypothetical protein